MALLAGLAGGLARMGWALPPPASRLALAHGPLMVSGFFGTLVALERAVAMRAAWVAAAPALLGAGGLLLVLGPVDGAERPAAALATAGAALYLAASLRLAWHHRAAHLAVAAAGAAALAGGDALWLIGRPVPEAVPWWLGFLVLTITGERLELSRLARPPAWAAWLLGALCLVLVAGLAAAPGNLATAWRLTGVALAGTSLWLLRFDLARCTVHLPGLPRFTALCLLSGYAWLGAAGVLGLLRAGEMEGGFAYDAVLHAAFLGFVMPMVFGHAPIVLPAVAGLRLPYDPALYLPLAALHASLALRLGADALGAAGGRAWGGLANAAAILLFAAVAARAALAGPAPPSQVRDGSARLGSGGARPDHRDGTPR